MVASVFVPAARLFVAATAVSLTASCSILAPLFGMEGTSPDNASLYEAAMADFSLCETAPNPSERTAAAARLAAAAGNMSATSQPTNPDHFFEMDRVVAANSRCQAVLSAR